ncbi:MAG: homospermidine synthase [Betaproteobacteria bacterium HGW-Betaproteobacteria-11]|nr:MAG: homospermidine synthase [Betaproteobacteria bacterium HGW-Betaproteobacteria-11]
MTKPVLVMAIGNESRGDDALGPLLARRLTAWLDGTECSEAVEVIEEFQLQVEHALDLQGRTLVLFVDAGEGLPAPFRFYEAAPRRPAGHTTHALVPEALLGIYTTVQNASPPPAFVLCIAGMSFELGEPLSPPGQRHLEEAFAFCRQLLQAPAGHAWHEQARAASDGMTRGQTSGEIAA